jgi:hypothetical protein
MLVEITILVAILWLLLEQVYKEVKSMENQTSLDLSLPKTHAAQQTYMPLFLKRSELIIRQQSLTALDDHSL